MIVLNGVMNWLTDISSWEVQFHELIGQQHEMRVFVLSQQREMAKVCEPLKAPVQVQNIAAKKQRSTCR